MSNSGLGDCALCGHMIYTNDFYDTDFEGNLIHIDCLDEDEDEDQE